MSFTELQKQEHKAVLLNRSGIINVISGLHKYRELVERLAKADPSIAEAMRQIEDME